MPRSRGSSGSVIHSTSTQRTAHGDIHLGPQDSTRNIENPPRPLPGPLRSHRGARGQPVIAERDRRVQSTSTLEYPYPQTHSAAGMQAPPLSSVAGMWEWSEMFDNEAPGMSSIAGPKRTWIPTLSSESSASQLSTPMHAATPQHVQQAIHLLGCVGKGSFGKVYAANVGAETLAVKMSRFGDTRVDREITIMQFLTKSPHPNVITLHSHHVMQDSNGHMACLVMELFPTSLAGLIEEWSLQEGGRPHWFHTKLFAFQLTRALAHIHGFGICHRDLARMHASTGTHACTHHCVLACTYARTHTRTHTCTHARECTHAHTCRSRTMCSSIHRVGYSSFVTLGARRCLFLA